MQSASNQQSCTSRKIYFADSYVYADTKVAYWGMAGSALTDSLHMQIQTKVKSRQLQLYCQNAKNAVHSTQNFKNSPEMWEGTLPDLPAPNLPARGDQVCS